MPPPVLKPASSRRITGLGPELSHQAWPAACAPFTPNHSEQRSPPTCYRGCWHVVSRGLFPGYRHQRAIPCPPYSSPGKELYNLTAFFAHAASLHHSNVAVHPLRPATHRRLGGPLPRRLANGPRTHPAAAPQGLSRPATTQAVSSGITPCFHRLFQTAGQVIHVLLTRPPLPAPRRKRFARLACLRRAASVRSEPGSNSPSLIRRPKTALLTIAFFPAARQRNRLLFPCRSFLN